MLSCKIFCIIFLIYVVALQAKPLEDTSTSVAQKDSAEEMMEGAESQNPFLPRFAMKKLRERTEKARAQRRNYLAQRKTNAPARASPCPQRYYKK